MFDSFNKLFGQKPQKGGPLIREKKTPAASGQQNGSTARPQTFSKVFRWRLPDGQTQAPGLVEIVGSFTQWQRVPLTRDSEVDAWHVTIHHIPGNRTHHYMLLVDGKPVHDKNADGFAIPHGLQEEQYQLVTEKGGRVFMLYAQTK